MTLSSGGLLTCCFCDLVPERINYVELELHVDESPARQFFGAHRACLSNRLARGFQLEIEPLAEI
ncbi:hypothetical protein CELD12_02680 [Cellulomonas sp. NTE-D12]|nr:hypothetical protein CELD12_02680 [Cellulomonas sp. NTE-D12]